MNIQRTFGKLTVKSEGHDAKVQILLDEFEQADQVLARFIDAMNAWREAWTSVLGVQWNLATTYEELYNPIAGASDGHENGQAMTPRQQIERSLRLKEAYTELRTDLLEEVKLTDSRIIKPAQEARSYMKPIKKVIKKHDNKRLDFERYQDRVRHAQKKQTMSEKEEASLAHAKDDLAKALDAFQVIDAHIRDILPPIIAAAFAILPRLLAVHIMTQNTLLAQYYTTLQTYCVEQGFPSQPPSMDEAVAQWQYDFKPIQEQVESITLIARGKAVQTSMQSSSEHRQSSVTGLNIRGNIRSRLPSSQNSKQTNSAEPGASDSSGFQSMKGNILSRLPSSQASKQANSSGSGPQESSSHLSRESSSGSIPARPVTRHTEYEEEAPPPRPPRPNSNRMSSSGASVQSRLRYDERDEEEAPPPKPPRPNFSPMTSNSGSIHSRPRYDEREEEAPPAKPPRPSFGRAGSSGGQTPGLMERDRRDRQYTNDSNSDSAGRIPSTTPSPRHAPSASSIAAKKKPPPPPPKPKRSQLSTYVTAIYPFEGQSVGDLSFSEGDRIKIIKKTNSNDDWWEGELNGRKGSFPANYCEMAL